MKNIFRRVHLPYKIMLAVNLSFLLLAFILDTPANIIDGFIKIITSPSILVTDYIYIGGIGAALLNVSIAGFVCVFTFIFSGLAPTGATIMGLWLTAGFAFFGKNVFNMLPLTFGVWLYAKYRREPFINYSTAAVLVATLSPVVSATLTPFVSEVSFLGILSRPIGVLLGVLFGFIVGFIFPAISTATVQAHGGYSLYNMGFSGGLIAVLVATLFKSMGVRIAQVDLWGEGHNLSMAILLYAISAAMFCCGLIGGAKKNLAGFIKIFKHSGRLVTDFYFLYGNSVYINMAVLCAFSTTLVLVFGGQINGTVLAGIFTIVGFGSFGKHLKNILPILIGAIISISANQWDFASPANIMTILFSTTLAPIAGQFGWFWGIIAGFLHVNVARHVGLLNGGLNLYNNGFAAGLVAMFLLPIINVFRKDKTDET